MINTIIIIQEKKGQDLIINISYDNNPDKKYAEKVNTLIKKIVKDVKRIDKIQ